MVAFADAVGIATAVGEDLIHLLSGEAAGATEVLALPEVEVDVVLSLAGVVGHTDAVGRAGLQQRHDVAADEVDALDDTDEVVRGMTDSAVMSSRKSWISEAARSRQSTPSRFARSSSGSSTSVTFWTKRTSAPASSSARLSRSTVT
ncbi:hypothetical protein GCM10025883_16020 [Mobilicoccus caccae]|uniref:Uncharacterized protein n=1 Tax=Mobilicoccus caccae TaxID=1859295 RepID=A0ABQ6IQT5_9MICO|nr:hypothetical protein GCM10025883_16020 [Mobilicoccus caccae]